MHITERNENANAESLGCRMATLFCFSQCSWRLSRLRGSSAVPGHAATAARTCDGKPAWAGAVMLVLLWEWAATLRGGSAYRPGGCCFWRAGIDKQYTQCEHQKFKYCTTRLCGGGSLQVRAGVGVGMLRGADADTRRRTYVLY